MSDLDRRIDRRIAVMQWFSMMGLAMLAAFALWNAAQRRWWWALFDVALIVYNLWFARWATQRSDRRIAAIKAEITRITQGSDNG